MAAIMSLLRAETSTAEWSEGLKMMVCGTCRGSTYWDPDLDSRRCQMCGREVVLQEPLEFIHPKFGREV